MRLLVDTHALLWWLGDDRRLGERARDIIGDPANDILVSVASLWEMTVKTRIGKLEADIAEIIEAIETESFDLLAIQPAHLRQLAGLPSHHRDPFDQLLIAQAIAERLTFMTEDRHAPLYPAQIIRCSDEVSSGISEGGQDPETDA